MAQLDSASSFYLEGSAFESRQIHRKLKEMKLYKVCIDISHIFSIEADDPSDAEFQAWQELRQNPENFGRAYVEKVKGSDEEE